jgi:phosphomannomutase
MGIETSGHYILREHNYIDSGLAPAALALAALVADSRPLSVVRADLDPYAHDLADLRVDDPEKKIDIVRKRHHAAILDELDGITVEYPDWWFNVRMSNTEPILRITIEAEKREVMARRLKELLALIG